MTMTTPTVESQRPDLDDSDEGRVAHYAPKAEVTRAYVLGEEIVALCGKVFRPTRDPLRYPVCAECRAIKEGR